jgi:diguanylate cyclase (GGDEF)-like protein
LLKQPTGYADIAGDVARHNVSSAAAAFPEPDPVPSSAPPEALVESYRRLAEVFHHVLSEQSVDTVLDRIADTLADLVPYDDLHVYQADVTRRVLEPVLARSKWQQEVMRTSPRFGEGITGWAVVHREPVLTNRAHLDSRVAFVPGTPVEPEALITVPLIARGSLKGALNIYRLGETATFDEDEFELAKWFGDAAALALDNAQVRARLEHQAQTDSLTGLYNHRFFHERLRAELTRAGRAHDTVAVLMFDIDDFKRVNDICSHAVGDEILRALAETIQALVRQSDVVCRIGGEEFAVIMPSCGSGDALGLARRLQQRLEAQPIDAAGEITLSMGIAQGPDHAMNPRELVACAETAMMAAKGRGKNRIVLFSDQTVERPDIHESARDIRSIAHLKMLQSLSGKLSRLSEVREIGEVIVSELRGLIDYHSCRVSLVEGNEVVPLTVWGDVGETEEELESLRVQLGEGITGYVAETGRPILVANALESEQGMQIPGTEPLDESVVAVPLRYGSRVTGVIFLSKLGVNQFDENDQRLLEVLAGYASVALENARLYESLRREAANAKAWLEFADAMSGAGSLEAMAEQAVLTVARLLEVEQCSLWLRDRREGDFTCAASHGYISDPTAEPITRGRVSEEAAQALIESRTEPFLLNADELRGGLLATAEEIEVRPIVIAPLHPGYGVRGWIGARSPDAGAEHFTAERMRLLDGLAYRASMALEKAILYNDQQESAHVANAMLEFAGALADARNAEELHERIVGRSAEILDVPEMSLWLQREEGGELEPVAAWDVDPGHRKQVLAARFPAAAGQPLASVPSPVVLRPEDYSGIPGAAELISGTDAAVASFTFDGGRMGFLAAGARPGQSFDELALKTLAGLADQAKLAMADAPSNA